MNEMSEKSKILTAEAFDRTLVRIAHEIIERNTDEKEICIIGILRRGATLAKRISESISRLSDITVRLGTLDITFYRDDLSRGSLDPSLNRTDVPFSIEGKAVVMVDDVLFTGRTARAAMDAIMAIGRPRSIQYAVLIDRGHRELPIRGDYVGKNVPTSRKEIIAVRVPEYDGVQEVVILGQKTDA